MALPLKIKTKRYKVPGSRKGKGGVPELYKPEYCKKMIKFFSKDPYKIVTLPDGTTKRYANDLPTLEHFANRVLHVGLKTLRDWAKRHSEFQTAIDRCREFQKDWFMVNGTKGLISSSFSIFVAQNVTDLRQKVEIDQTNTNLYPEGIQVNFTKANHATD